MIPRHAGHMTPRYAGQSIGGPIFTTPETVLEAMRRVNTDVETMNGEIIANMAQLPPQFLTAWGLFRLEWQSFYAANQSEMAMLVKGTGTVMRETQDYSSRVVQWRSELAAQPGVKLITPAPIILHDPSTPPPSGPAVSQWTDLIHAATVLAGVLLVGYVAAVYVPKFLPMKGSA